MNKKRLKEYRPYRVTIYALFLALCAYLTISILVSIGYYLWQENGDPAPSAPESEVQSQLHEVEDGSSS